MIKQQRQQTILQQLQEKHFCTVRSLADSLYVAPITIRRDLGEMEKAGLVQRCHGGAQIPDHQNREVPFVLRSRANQTAKIKLAQQAAQLIHHGNTVFMDASTTVSHIADFLTGDQELTVITNSVYLLEKLRSRHIRCYLTGGMLLENSFALVGKLAQEAVSNLHADLCFFSSQGISLEGVISDFSEEETRLRQCMIQNSNRSVFLFDRSKLGKQFLFRVCHAEDLTQVIGEGEYPWK